MYPISDVALAIVDSIEIPADINDILNTFTPYKRKSIMNGEYTVYHDELNEYYMIRKPLQEWLETLPKRLDDIGMEIDSYQLVVYTPENNHDVEYYGYYWFEINLGLVF